MTREEYDLWVKQIENTHAFLKERWLAFAQEVGYKRANQYEVMHADGHEVTMEASRGGDTHYVDVPLSYIFDPDAWREERERKQREARELEERVAEERAREVERRERAQLRRLRAKYETTKEA